VKTKRLEPDGTDKRLIMELRKDCRRSYRQLASALGMSPAAIMERMKWLEEKGYIQKYAVIPDWEKLGYEFVAAVQISMSHGAALLEVQKQIAKLPGVAAVYDITGQYDSMAILKCKSRQELSTLVKRILNLPKVEKTNTSMVLNVIKEVSEFSGV
jgi:DNA-binding Lrp family transcriptional regulator